MNNHQEGSKLLVDDAIRRALLEERWSGSLTFRNPDGVAYQLEINDSEYTLNRERDGGNPILTTYRPLRILMRLMVAKLGREEKSYLSTKEIYADAWGAGVARTTEISKQEISVDRQISDLRAALDDRPRKRPKPREPRIIGTVHGHGFRFLPDEIKILPGARSEPAQSASVHSEPAIPLGDGTLSGLSAGATPEPYLTRDPDGSLMLNLPGDGVVKVIDVDDLVASERDASQVIVHATQPIEQENKAVAAQVLENLRGGTEYIYILGFSYVAWQIHALATAGSGDIEENLSAIRKKVAVYVVKSQLPFEFIIRGSSSLRHGTFYLNIEHTDHFIEWGDSRTALGAAKHLRNEIGIEPDQHGIRLSKTHPVSRMAKKEREAEWTAMRRTLWNDLEGRFIDYRSEKVLGLLREICFGKE
jgi:DNA-binding winged helix-turn-helix (wHTH) protein